MPANTPAALPSSWRRAARTGTWCWRRATTGRAFRRTTFRGCSIRSFAARALRGARRASAWDWRWPGAWRKPTADPLRPTTRKAAAPGSSCGFRRPRLRPGARPGRADRRWRRGGELIEHLARGPRPCQPKRRAHESLRVHVLEEGQERTVVAVGVEQPDGLLVQPELAPGRARTPRRRGEAGGRDRSTRPAPWDRAVS